MADRRVLVKRKQHLWSEILLQQPQGRIRFQKIVLFGYQHGRLTKLDLLAVVLPILIKPTALGISLGDTNAWPMLKPA